VLEGGRRGGIREVMGEGVGGTAMVTIVTIATQSLLDGHLVAARARALML
jgi:hypothetical protein